MDINFSGYNETVLTFECTSGVTAGIPVKMSAAGKVTAASANDTFIGVARSVRDGYAAVQLGGYVEMKKNGTIGLGYTKLVAAAEGVKAAETGIDRLVIYSDSNNVGFIL